MPVLQLGNEDTRIVALAVAYHLGRPGSETDPDTLQRHELGLGPLAARLRSGVEQARVELSVTPYQLHRLDEALLGTTNELKQYEMSQRRSTVPEFGEAIARLFPELAADGSALDLVERVVLLRRRLRAAVGEAEAALAAEQAEAERARRASWWWRRLLHPR